METATLVHQIGEMIKDAAGVDEIKSSVTSRMIDLGRKAASIDEFVLACREAEGKWREETGEKRLPQPYANAKSTVKYALVNGQSLAQKGKPVSFTSLRQAVSAHRNKNREEKAPEKEQLAEAISRVKEANNPLLMLAAAQALQSVVESFERARESAQAASKGAVTTLGGRTIESRRAAAH